MRLFRKIAEAQDSRADAEQDAQISAYQIRMSKVAAELEHATPGELYDEAARIYAETEAMQYSITASMRAERFAKASFLATWALRRELVALTSSPQTSTPEA